MKNNACPSRITATAGTRLVGTDSPSNVIIFLDNRILQSITTFFIHLMSLDQAFAHCPIFHTAASLVKFEPYFNSTVAGHPLRPAKDHRLGKPLPHQQSNLAQAYQKDDLIYFPLI